MGGSAGEIFRFTVEHESEHKSERLLSGKDHKFYTFKIPQMWLSGTHAKFGIQVQQHVLDEAPAILESQYFYLRVGQSENIKPTYWDIRLDRIDGMRVNFSVLYRDELLHEKKARGYPRHHGYILHDLLGPRRGRQSVTIDPEALRWSNIVWPVLVTPL